MALASPAAGIVGNVEFPTGRRALIINRAGDAMPDVAGQRHAAGLAGIGAGHADNGRGDGQRHGGRHPCPPGKGAAGQLDRVKIDAEAGTAGTAGLANTHRRLIRQRHN